MWGLDLKCVMWDARCEVWLEKDSEVVNAEEWGPLWEARVVDCRSQAVGFRWCARGDGAVSKVCGAELLCEVPRVGCQFYNVWCEVWSQKSEGWENMYKIPYTLHSIYFKTLRTDLDTPSYISRRAPCITLFTLRQTMSQSIHRLFKCKMCGGTRSVWEGQCEA